MTTPPLDAVQQLKESIGITQAGVMMVGVSMLRSVIDRLEAAEAKVAAVREHCQSAEWMADDNGDQWEAVTVADVVNALGVGE